MAIKTVRCHVLQAPVTVVTDLEGTITHVICPEYKEPTGICRLKRGAEMSGPLSRLLERVSEDTLDTRTHRCEVAA
jgi:hypothetical protein